MIVKGELIGALTAGEEVQIYLYFCHAKPKRMITISDGGRFSEELAYSYGGVYMFFPPLGEFPERTPPPPNICISFPSEAEEYYLIRLDRENAKWRMLYRKPENPGAKVMLSLKQVDLEELNKRGNFNDWLLRLRLTK